MERRGWIVALGALALIGAGLYVWWSDSSHVAPDARVARVGGGAADGAGGGGASADGAEPGGAPASARRRRGSGDGGVPHVGLRPDEPRPAVDPETGVRTSRGIPREDPGAHESAGWRLGQARRRIAILEDSERLYQSAVDRFLAEGNAETAERQRVVLERVQRRLEEFRTDERELLQEAQAEGTMGDVDRGYEEGDAPPQQIQGGTTSTR